MTYGFAPSHRGGAGPPLLLVHGFLETWRSWELVLPRLERRREVFAPTLPGHAGGPPLASADRFLEGVEGLLDAACLEKPHVAGSSLGGWVALRLAERGRARSVVALAPAGGWDDGDLSYRGLLAEQRELHELAQAAAPHADALVATAAGRRRALLRLTERPEQVPADLAAHLVRGVAGCDGADALVAAAVRAGWPLDPAGIDCPVRIVWGTADRLLPWPSAAARYRRTLPHADWVVLDGIGHCPQLDAPPETAELILGLE